MLVFDSPRWGLFFCGDVEDNGSGREEGASLVTDLLARVCRQSAARRLYVIFENP